MSDPRTTPPLGTGISKTIGRGRAGLRREPSPHAVQDNELLFGDVFTVFSVWPGGWLHGQCAYDGYVGYIRDDTLADPVEPTHRVTALSTPLLEGPAIRAATRELLPLNAQVKALEFLDGFARIAPDGFIWSEHLVPIDRLAPDWVATAERFLGSPYVWGGKTHHGIDCSGLVQIALASAGIRAPRDTDQQETALGTAITSLARERGDLIFWNGHVGIMLDETGLLHANAFHMQVEIERLAEAIARIAPVAGPVTSIRRL